MHKYIPHTKEDIKMMLDELKANSLEDLYSIISNDLRLKESYHLDDELSDYEVFNKFLELSNKNKQLNIFRGYGAYDHITPSIIFPLITRQEFLTSYTPYQPEVAQGTLHYIFEYQSMITKLTNMDVSNASMYDGSTSSAEAVMMAYDKKKGPVLISNTVHPKTIEVIKTYAKYKDIPLKFISEKDGITNIDELMNESNFSACLIQNPNYYGNIENLDKVSDFIHDNKALFILNMDAATLSHLKSPGELNADIAVGELQSLGIPLSSGGPYIGYLATREKLIRKMPGRICGLTKDRDGKDGFVLTFQAREQHIRRAKANSNICSNQSLQALFVTIYLAVMGKKGLYEASQNSINNSHYLYNELLKTKKFEKVFNQEFFKEFALKPLFDLDEFNEYLLKHNILGPEKINNGYALFAVTEKKTKKEIDQFVELVVNFK